MPNICGAGGQGSPAVKRKYKKKINCTEIFIFGRYFPRHRLTPIATDNAGTKIT